jgi:prepilin-type N-terminal cleavage/methylation domain-containing protein
MIFLKNNIRNYNRGFTLMEIVVVIGIFAAIAISIGNFQFDVFRNNRFSSDSLNTLYDARTIVSTMVKELRSASPGNTGAFTIVQAATNTLTFFSDTDGDSLKEQIRYYLATTTLKKGVIKPTGNPLSYNSNNETFSYLAYNIRNSSTTPLFEYFDTNYMGTSSPLTQPVITTNVRLIKINLMIDVDPNRAPVIKTYTSQVSIRNLKDNL